jgi:hypothetical protein
MDDIPSILDARQRARYHRDANGISELVVGLALLIFGSQHYFSVVLAPFGALGRVLVVLVIIVLYGLLMLNNRAIAERIKERLVYPRTGYVAAPDEETTAGAANGDSSYVFLTLATIIGLALFASSSIIPDRWIYSTAILLLFASYVFASGQFKLDPLRSALFLVPLAGGLAWWTFSRPIPRFNLLLEVVGGSLAIGGAIRLSLYLHRNPRSTSTTP